MHRSCRHRLRPKILDNRLGNLKKQWIIISFFIFERSTFKLGKSKYICYVKCLVHPIQVTGSTYCRIVFETMYISKICA